MNNTIHYTNCPLCNHNSFEALVEAKDYTVSDESFKILSCNKCKFRFTQDIPTQESIGKYYASENYISHSNTNKGLINKLYHFARNYMLSSKVNLVEKKNKDSKKTILDIGTGTGYFLNAMKEKKWDTFGIEADEGARNQAISNFNLPISDVQQLFEFENNSFQAITMWHVLEHVHTLHEYIAQIHQLLNNKGILIIAVPNSDCYDAQHYKSYWAGWDVPRHLYHFTPASMKILLEKHEFEIIEQKMMPFDPFYISLLSEKYQDNSLAFVKGMFWGKISFLKSVFNTNKASSVIYIAQKKPS